MVFIISVTSLAALIFITMTSQTELAAIAVSSENCTLGNMMK
jgi:hypothetical protein